MNTTEQNNRLIAEFMGMQDTPIGWYDNEEAFHSLLRTEGNTFDNLLFNTSWDWLMPVVVECFNRYDDIEFMNNDVFRADNHQFKLNDALLETNINSLYETVVEFVKWYNENQPINYFDDWVKEMMSQSDYSEVEIMEFEEHYQNLLSFEENIEMFLEFRKENLYNENR